MPRPYDTQTTSPDTATHRDLASRTALHVATGAATGMSTRSPTRRQGREKTLLRYLTALCLVFGLTHCAKGAPDAEEEEVVVDDTIDTPDDGNDNGGTPDPFQNIAGFGDACGGDITCGDGLECATGDTGQICLRTAGGACGASSDCANAEHICQARLEEGETLRSDGRVCCVPAGASATAAGQCCEPGAFQADAGGSGGTCGTASSTACGYLGQACCYEEVNLQGLNVSQCVNRSASERATCTPRTAGAAPTRNGETICRPCGGENERCCEGESDLCNSGMSCRDVDGGSSLRACCQEGAACPGPEPRPPVPTPTTPPGTGDETPPGDGGVDVPAPGSDPEPERCITRDTCAACIEVEDSCGWCNGGCVDMTQIIDPQSRMPVASGVPSCAYDPNDRSTGLVLHEMDCRFASTSPAADESMNSTDESLPPEGVSSTEEPPLEGITLPPPPSL